MSVISRICILGGGTAGWMTAAALSHKFKDLNLDLSLVESDQIGTVGVGEATLPHIRFFNQALGIDEAAFMKSTEATFKLGIEFCDWGKKGDHYIHPFGDYGVPIDELDFHQFWLKLRKAGGTHRLSDYSYPILAAEQGRFRIPAGDLNDIGSNFGYAYQFDAGLYAKFLRTFSEANGVRRVEGRAVEVGIDGESGNISSIKLEDGHVIEADLFVDCSGFRGLLIEQELKTGYDDWSHWLPCNRAVAVPCESRGELRPYTRATARTAGWQWRIPLQHRTGNGHVYWNEFISDDEATHQLMSTLDGPALAEPKQLFFKTGRRKKFWNRNVVSIGLSAGFLEPLESTSIHLIQEGITTLIELFPRDGVNPLDINEYNARMGLNFERVRDFLLLHYVATQRDDSEMWRYFQAMELPDSLQEKLSAWNARGYVLQYEFGVFLPPSWVAVMHGQNLIPEGHDPRVDRYSIADIEARLEQIRLDTVREVETTPTQVDFLRRHGAASGSPLVSAGKM
ncbi:MAG: tryptophan 7-halogenase [Maricaulis sp.]|uniref:tryptophan halogenase family protein n=1 Tax=Maricaulis sp. TaxID=1486257 RepID=UPI002626049F|nr:tryptophan halogenase family protein [Maricaulis sp.]MDM7984202.1 tryptophan 7-halogenase [Maricaulis sp.]